MEDHSLRTVIAAVVGASLGAGAAVLIMKASQRPVVQEAKEGRLGDTITSLCRNPSKGGDVNRPIYLDWNATTPIFPEVRVAMEPFTFRYFGNPSSSNAFSKHCAASIRSARIAIARMISCDADEVVFTSCGTESDNAAIKLALASSTFEKPHVVTTNIEHPAIEECLALLQEQGAISVTRVPVGKDGIVPTHAIAEAIQHSTCLVSVMHSNNEIGSINPVAAVAALCRQKGILCHTDAAQSCGKVKIDVQALGVDMLTVVGHKFGAPKGVAALYIRNNCLSESSRKPPPKYGSSGFFLLGGGQESGRRGGTENVLQIAALGCACEIVAREIEFTYKHMQRLRARLLMLLQEDASVYSIVNGPKASDERLPNTLSISFKNVDSGRILAAVKDKVSASAGSACHTGGGVSAVLQAIEVPKDYIKGTLRLSVGRHTTDNDVDEAATIILEQVRKLTGN